MHTLQYSTYIVLYFITIIYTLDLNIVTNNKILISTCYLESIRKMKKISDSTDVEIEKPLKNWMAQATPRIKKTMYGKNDSLNTELLKLN